MSDPFCAPRCAPNVAIPNDPIVMPPPRGGNGIYPFDASLRYPAYIPVTYEGQLYISNKPTGPGAFNPADWDVYGGGDAPGNSTVAYVAHWTVNFASGEYALSVAVPREISFPANFTGSQYDVKATPPVTLTLDVLKNDVSIGTIQITDNVATFTTAATTFAADDVLVLRCTSGGVFDYVTVSLVGTQAP